MTHIHVLNHKNRIKSNKNGINNGINNAKSS